MIFLVLIVTYLSTIQGNPVKSNDSARIINGQDARAGQFPYSVAIQVKTDTSLIFCGGALLSPEWIITSANCVQNAVQFNISLGSNTLEEEDSNRIHIIATTYFSHPEYDNETLDNDLGLIKLREKIQFSDYIDRIHLPVVNYSNGSKVVAVGWGQTTDFIPGPVNHLQFVELIIISNEQCMLTYGPQITENMVCAEGSFQEGICTGDSGGPLVYFLNNQHPILVAVASFHSAFGCERPDPSGYIKIFPYLKWIAETTGGLMLNYSEEYFDVKFK